jgi:CO/xanthine dehydrogenase Mo-binding subunit
LSCSLISNVQLLGCRKEVKVEEYEVVGKPLPRIDGKVKVTGAATYADDLILPGMLHGRMLRSPYAHARILNIDTSKAEKLPGVRAVVTGKDFPGILIGFMREYADRPPIAIDKVRHYGEAVAAVAAIDEDIAEEALDLIEVDYEELPPVLNWEEAMKEGAPLVHDKAKGNIGASCQFEYGDVEKALAECDYVRREKFVSQRVAIGFIEPHTALASVDPSGRVLFQGSKQSPYITWRHLCWGLDMPLDKIRMVNPYVGGAFSGKHEAFDLDFCAVRLAQKTGRPVKIITNQDDVIGTYRQRHEKHIWLKMGMKKDGTLVALDCKLIADGGAYLSVATLNLYNFALCLSLPLRIPSIRYEAYRVYTNLPICGAVRGQSQVIGYYALSSMVSMMADDLGLDVTEVVLKNLVKEGETLTNGAKLGSVGIEEAIKKVTDGIGWKEKKSRKIANRGLGFACGAQISGMRMGGHHAGAAVIKVSEDGTINLIHGGTELGQGCDTVMAQIAAEVLGLGLEDVHVEKEDSHDTFFDSGMFSDKCTVWTGNAVRLAAEDARKKLAKVAAEMLGVKAEDLIFKNRKVYVRDNPDRELSFLRLVRSAQYGLGQCIYGCGSWAPPGVKIVDFSKGDAENFTPSFSFVAQAVEVEVDPETGRVKLLSSVAADDCGQPINPLLVEGQMDGGSVHMIGHGLYEEALYNEKGQALASSLRDYKLPIATDIPKLTNYHVITHDPEGPFGAKGAGETSTTAIMAAIRNAIEDAVGARINDPPFTPEKVLKAIKKGNN